MRGFVVVLVVLLLMGCSGEAAMDTSEPWDLVWYSDSTGFGLAELWAERIEKELGVEVRVNDFSSGGLPAATVLGWIGEGIGLPVHRELLAGAEIVVVFGNPRNSGATDDLETCVSTSTAPRDGPSDTSIESWEPYRDVLTSIWEIIFDLRDGEPTILRAMDMYNPVIADWREAGIEEECAAGWEAFAQTIKDAAADYDVPTASMFDAFNGTSHDEDPREKGFIGSDKMHTTDEGKAAMVEVLHALGYEPVGG